MSLELTAGLLSRFTALTSLVPFRESYSHCQVLSGLSAWSSVWQCEYGSVQDFIEFLCRWRLSSFFSPLFFSFLYFWLIYYFVHAIEALVLLIVLSITFFAIVDTFLCCNSISAGHWPRVLYRSIDVVMTYLPAHSSNVNICASVDAHSMNSRETKVKDQTGYCIERKI